MEQSNSLNQVLDNVQKYLETQKQLVKLEVIEKVSEASASAASESIVFVFYLLFFLFISIGLAMLVGDLLGKGYLGFAAVAVLYLFVALILNVRKEKWLKTPIANSFVKTFMKNE